MERTVVRVAVAVGAFAERDSHQLNQLRVACQGLVALFTCHAGMLARQCKTGFGMVKMADFFPVVKVVALLALFAKPSAVWVLVAAGASARQPEKSTVQVFFAYFRAFCRRNMTGVVALLAAEPRMFALQRITCFRVIEPLFGGHPVNDLKVYTVVFRMAVDTPLFVGLLHQAGVVSAAGRDALGNRLVALQALEPLASPCKAVARRALCCPAQKLMRTRKRSGRNLR